MADLIDDFMEALLSLDKLAAEQMMTNAKGRMPPIEFVEDVVIVALERIGTRWEQGTVALSQVYMAGRICESLVDEILPPADPARKSQPKMAICVLSDHHKLGKVIVYSLLRAGGFELADYGTMEVDGLVDRVKTDKIEILFISTLMLASALKVKKVTEKLLELNVTVVVGGAPFRFDDRLWRDVGADAMCRTASEAVSVIHAAMGGDS